MARYALLIGSSQNLMGGEKIRRGLVDTNVQAMAEVLSNLGTYSFTWPKSRVPEHVGGNRIEVSRKLDTFRTQRITIGRHDIFLLYYFGHGLIKGDDELCMSFVQLNLLGDVRQYYLSSVLSEIRNIGFKKIVIILDCCHSGNAEGSVNRTLSDVAHCLLTATSSSWAYFSESGGTFTQALSRALSYKNVMRSPRYDGITFESWFRFVHEELEEAKQSPRASGSLLREVLVPYEIEIEKSFNERAPLKSLYHKLYSILGILTGTYRSLDEIYSQIGRLRPPEFLISTVTTEGTLAARLVMPNKVAEYLSLVTSLGFAESGGGQRWRLSALGRAARGGDGSEYNINLVESIERKLQENGLSRKIIKENLFLLTDQGRVPNLANMARLLIEQKTKMPERKAFRYWMSLLGYARVIQRATTDTYFPR